VPVIFFIFELMNIESLREYCLALPSATEDIKWGHDLCFSIGEKMFCVTGLVEPWSTSFKVTDENFTQLVAQEGIIPAPYMARHKWVRVDNLDIISDKEFKKLIKESYDLVKSKLPRKTQATLK
jgi:predicted DNA-binding protein (MmcQ/YjbR family)